MYILRGSIDMQGREWVIEKNKSTFQPIDISGLTKGYYLAILEYNGLVKQIPFIKQ
ncbi:MAG: T9SS type A sorting domain-containing protein [Candidatus Competibacteraceae bacterium]|nr:T9SS type A sorting domain-containing protein [Candidatus Competibacteraceae bacterium]